MLNEYSSLTAYSDAQVAAVSELMYELGVINQADYEASGTWAGSNVSGINEHFFIKVVTIYIPIFLAICVLKLMQADQRLVISQTMLWW
ncbi:hypothetical protein CCP3SC15_30056 [Gammaproteobacteria bacterium]